MALTQLAPWNGANGVAATAANTGFQSITKTDTAATMPFRRGASFWQPRNEALVEFLGTTTAGYVLGVIQPGTSTDAVAIDVPIEIIEMPNAESPILSFHQTTDARQISLVLFASGALAVRNGANAALWTGTGVSATGLMAAGGRYIIRMFLTRDATNGSFRVQILNGETEAVIAGGDTGLRTAQNTGGTTITHIKVQSKGASGSVIPAKYAFGVPRYDWAATDFVPLWTAPAQRTGVQLAHPTTGAWTDATVQIRHPTTGAWVTVSLP